MALASSAPGASARVGGAELAAYAARRARLKRAQAVKQYVSMQTAGFARIRSFDVHPAVRYDPLPEHSLDTVKAWGCAQTCGTSQVQMIAWQCG